MKPLDLYEPRVCTAGGVMAEQSRLKTRISTASSAINTAPARQIEPLIKAPLASTNCLF